MPTVTAGTNSYLSEADAGSYFDERLHTTNWTAASSEEQQASLLMACNFLERRIRWNGLKADSSQALEWPRSGCVDQDGVSIDNSVTPQAIKDAQAELALVLLGRDLTEVQDAAGFAKAEAVGPIKVTYDTASRVPVIPDQIFQLIVHLGIRVGGPGSVTVRLA